MATSSEAYVGVDVSKDRLDVAVLGEERGWQVDNSQEGIAKLVQQMQEVCPELIVVEATGGYQRGVVDALFDHRKSRLSWFLKQQASAAPADHIMPDALLWLGLFEKDNRLADSFLFSFRLPIISL